MATTWELMTDLEHRGATFRLQVLVEMPGTPTKVVDVALKSRAREVAQILLEDLNPQQIANRVEETFRPPSVGVRRRPIESLVLIRDSDDDPLRTRPR